MANVTQYFAGFFDRLRTNWQLAVYAFIVNSVCACSYFVDSAYQIGFITAAVFSATLGTQETASRGLLRGLIVWSIAFFLVALVVVTMLYIFVIWLCLFYPSAFSH